MFFFGTPIGNRTLVSAVRGRRLEPLDHEGKSILLCNNTKELRIKQVKIKNFFAILNKIRYNYKTISTYKTYFTI